ncbi:PREDICTED: uncharacterized protein LOC106814535 [Priapulus caudatus]|uniref:Uncharacterized protein LOC106814535 n=1 Tax=Priapulus caudatus TaxID=37621 RepID=A0ABM1EQ66_PRICU|nr:PREDICTED: uncharacterized protein LOC106814535 [Priapulus caudatus]
MADVSGSTTHTLLQHNYAANVHHESSMSSNTATVRSRPEVDQDVKIALSHFKEVFLPSEYAYHVNNFEQFVPDVYSGAPDIIFRASVWVNKISDRESFDIWLKAFQNLTRTEYRVTRTHPRVKGKFVMYRGEYHCQHRTRSFHYVPVKKKSLTSSAGRRSRKADCNSSICLTVYTSGAEIAGGCSNMRCLLRIDYCHSHAIDSAHMLSFRKVSDATRQKFLDLFEAGHSAVSAKLLHETEMQLQCEPDEIQDRLADRSINPRDSDVYNIYKEWHRGAPAAAAASAREQCVDHRRLETLVREYNETHAASGGNASIDAPVPAGTDHDYARRDDAAEPAVIAVCTPIMRRAHKTPSHAKVFCDAASSFRRHGYTTLVLSSDSPAGPLLLGVVIVSDDSPETLTRGLAALKRVVPGERAFHGNGADGGPAVVVAGVEAALAWLCDARNGVTDWHDRRMLACRVSAVLRADTATDACCHHEQLLECPVARKHERFLAYYRSLWLRRKEWVLPHQSRVDDDGSDLAHTGMRLLREIAFQRTKARSIAQMFMFVTTTLELYLRRRLLSPAQHGRLDHFLLTKYKGLNREKVRQTDVTAVSDDAQFEVRSSTKRNAEHWVDMRSGVCSCAYGIDGALCEHQAAVLMKTRSQAAPPADPAPMTERERTLCASVAIGERTDEARLFLVLADNTLVEIANTPQITALAELCEPVNEGDGGGAAECESAGARLDAVVAGANDGPRRGVEVASCRGKYFDIATSSNLASVRRYMKVAPPCLPDVFVTNHELVDCNEVEIC